MRRMHPLTATGLLLVALLAVSVVLYLQGEPVHWPAFAAVVVFYCAIFLLGALAGRGKGDASVTDMILAGRAVPLGIAIFTMSATWVGGGYINGTAESTSAAGLVWVQAPWGYALSLILGGLFFARPMRRHRFTTMLDPFAQRYGDDVGALLFLPALLGEIFWTAAILTALGTTFGAVLGIDFQSAIVISAVIVISYTAMGGLWAVAVTDLVQILILIIGLWLVVPVALEQVGGLEHAWGQYVANHGEASALFPPWGAWRADAWGDLYWNWWDYALLLVFGGIPWHVYFQRVLSARNERTAANLSMLAGVVCLFAAVPAVLLGIVGNVADWSSVGVAAPDNPALTLPYVLRYLTNPLVATVGLGALAAAVMSSVDSSILSATSMTAWNVYRPLVSRDVGAPELTRVIKRTTWVVGGAATLLALQIESVYTLWFLCSDFVYAILFPQLVAVLFDRRANRMGAIAGFGVSFVLRIGGGEPALGIARLLPYPMVAESGEVMFPFRTLAMVSGLVTIVVVSRLTRRWSEPRALESAAADDATAGA